MSEFIFRKGLPLPGRFMYAYTYAYVCLNQGEENKPYDSSRHNNATKTHVAHYVQYFTLAIKIQLLFEMIVTIKHYVL